MDLYGWLLLATIWPSWPHLCQANMHFVSHLNNYKTLKLSQR